MEIEGEGIEGEEGKGERRFRKRRGRESKWVREGRGKRPLLHRKPGLPGLLPGNC